MNIRSVILAAGQGTRMKSTLPKVLHPLLGRPMLQYALDTAAAVSQEQPVVIIGHGASQIQQVFNGKAHFVLQEPQLGTGHAIQQAEVLLRDDADYIVVTYADMPLLTAETLQRVVQAQKTNSGPMTMLTVMVEDPRGFGRVVRGENGHVTAIVEETQATPEQRPIRELNVGVYCFTASWLWDTLRRVPLSPKGEYYLTDVVALAVEDGLSVEAVSLDDPEEGIGINTRSHLAEAMAILRRRINQRWMLEGVTLIDPATTYIEPSVSVGMDTVIWPNSHLLGNTTVGEGCIVGPNAILRDSQVGAHCTLVSSVLEGARLEERVHIGPYCHLRRGAHLEQGVHLGNFGEIKNSHLGPGTKMGHFSYIGDAEIGSNVNIGAGTITCNFDGVNKNYTEIAANVFIGSDTMLVAPVKLGEGAQTGAGAVVTKDIPPYTLAVGIPARKIRKLEKRD
jgi:bifunctional UDP-N-acetylglucosamine pyrophosphorylase / glucosamine-1-phosphate N-acetyltransferase